MANRVQQAASERLHGLDDASADLSARQGWAGHIARESSIPLYHQVFMDLRRRLMAGQWEPGAAFLRDSDIEAAYNVSRITARKAVDKLVDENLISRFRGRGSFVTQSASVGPIGQQTGAFSDMADHSFDLLNLSTVQLSQPTASKLALAPDITAFQIIKLHRNGGFPVAIEHIYVHESVIGATIEATELRQSGFDALYGKRGIRVGRVDQIASAIMPSSDISDHLDTGDSQPVLYLTQIHYDIAGRPLDFRKTYLRTDRFQLSQTISLA